MSVGVHAYPMYLYFVSVNLHTSSFLQSHPYPRKQFLYCKWLCEIIVCACVKPRHLIHHGIPGSEHYDRHITLLADSPEYLQSVECRQHHIQDHKIEATGQSFVQPCSSVKCLLSLISLMDKLQLNKSCNFLFVLHNENPLCHIFFLSFTYY